MCFVLDVSTSLFRNVGFVVTSASGSRPMILSVPGADSVSEIGGEGRVKPVSYTHLDVYKRQVLTQRVVVINLILFFFTICMLLLLFLLSRDSFSLKINSKTEVYSLVPNLPPQELIMTVIITFY